MNDQEPRRGKRVIIVSTNPHAGEDRREPADDHTDSCDIAR